MKQLKLSFLVNNTKRVLLVGFLLGVLLSINGVSGVYDPGPCIPGVNCPGDGDDGGGGSEPDTTSPTVSITSPSDGSTVKGTITISVSASDRDSGMDKVKFYINGMWIATDYSSTYSTSWNTAGYSDGEYFVRAVAYDNAGNSKSDTHVVEVDNIADPTPPDFQLNAINMEYVSQPDVYQKGETMKVTFEVENTGTSPASNIQASIVIENTQYDGFDDIVLPFIPVNDGIFTGPETWEYTFTPFFDYNGPKAFNVGNYTIKELILRCDETPDQSFYPNLDFDIINDNQDKSQVFRLALWEIVNPTSMFNSADSRFDSVNTGEDLRLVEGIQISTYVYEYDWSDYMENNEGTDWIVNLGNDQAYDKLKDAYQAISGYTWDIGNHTYKSNSGFDMIYGFSNAQNLGGNTGVAYTNLAFNFRGNLLGETIDSDHFDELIQHETSHLFDAPDYDWGYHVMNHLKSTPGGFYHGNYKWQDKDADTIESNSDWWNLNLIAPSI